MKTRYLPSVRLRHMHQGVRCRVLLTLGLALLPSLACAQTIDTPYTFTTLAGSASIGSTDEPVQDARFFQPNALAVDAAGNVYVADCENFTIRKIAPDRTVTTLALTAASTDSTPPATSSSSTTPPSPGGNASSGGGAIEAWFAAMLALLATARMFSRFS